MSCQLHAPATLPPEQKPRYDLCKTLGWSQSYSEHAVPLSAEDQLQVVHPSASHYTD
jgi:hypothetical protein